MSKEDDALNRAVMREFSKAIQHGTPGERRRNFLINLAASWIVSAIVTAVLTAVMAALGELPSRNELAIMLFFGAWIAFNKADQ